MARVTPSEDDKKVQPKLPNPPPLLKDPLAQWELNESLLRAAENGSVEEVKALMTSGAQVDYKQDDWRRETALYKASENGHSEIVEILLNHHANPDVTDGMGWTALWIASSSGHSEVVKILLHHKANPHITDDHGRSPLHYAHNVQIADLLISHGASVEAVTNDGKSPLHCARDVQIADLLVCHGASVNAVTNKGDTVLHTSARTIEMAKYFIEKGVPINSLSNNKDSVLHTAMTVEVAEYFVENGVPIESRNKNEDTVLHTNRYSKIAKYLIDKGLSVDSKNKHGETPIHTNSNRNVSECLISSGCDMNVKTNEGNTVSHSACKFGNHELVKYLLENKLFNADLLNNNGESPLDIVVQVQTNERLSAGRWLCRNELQKKGLYEGPKEDKLLTTAYRGVNEATGRMKVARVLLHGPPRVGKTSVKLLVLGKPPKKQDSTGLIEDPVRAISTVQLLSVQETSLEEMDEKKMLMMIQFEIHKAAEEYEKKLESSQPSTNTAATDHKQNSQPAAAQHHTTTQSTSSTPTEGTDTPHSGTRKVKYNKLLSKIAADLDSIGPKARSLFECKHVHLIDSGGQPQFSNILPLVFQSQSHHHMVVIRLDEKLSDKPPNCYEINGVKYVFPECLLLTNYQLIERVCQLAAGSGSLVIVIGTHLDEENVEEPLAKKNELLIPLMKKYEDNLALTEEDEPIFAVNAMAPEGDERTQYAETLRRVVLSAPVLGEEGSMIDTAAEEGSMYDTGAEEGIVVPLRWIILELELSRRSKEIGILDKAEIHTIAQSLQISNLDQALAFFKKLAIQYHYPEILPNKIFTSIAPISSRLSKVVEATFPHQKQFRRDPDQARLQKTGEMTRKYLRKIIPLLKAVDDQFSVEDFITLMKHLRVIFEIEDGSLLFPSLLPLEAQSTADNGYRQEPLFLFWLNEDGEKAHILPQSFFHALVVELLRRKDVKLSGRTANTRTSFTFNVKVDSQNECRMVLTDRVFWMEVKTSAYCKRKECESIEGIVQSSTQRVLEQLKLTSLGELKRGVECRSKNCDVDYPHPSRRVFSGACPSEVVFSCVVSDSETACEWHKPTEEELFWFQEDTLSHTTDANSLKETSTVSCSLSSGSSVVKTGTELEAIKLALSPVPTTLEVFNILEDKSAEWDSIGRQLNISVNDRKSIRSSSLDDKGKLESVIDKWIETESLPVTWNILKGVLSKLRMQDILQKLNSELHS